MKEVICTVHNDEINMSSKQTLQTVD